MLLILILLVVVDETHAQVLARDSVIVTAANELAAQLTASNRFVLDSLYAAERAGVDPSDSSAVYAAVSASQRLNEPAWQAKMTREFERRASFVTDGTIDCRQMGVVDNGDNVTGLFDATAFLGESVFLDSRVYVDVDCSETFDASIDFGAFNLSIFNITTARNPLIENTTAAGSVLIAPLEIVQSTADVRFKRIVTLVPVLNSTDTGLFFQPGLASAFLPMLAAYQPVFPENVFGQALYRNEDFSEAPITRIVAMGTQCVADGSGARFDNATIDLRLALTSTNAVLNRSFPHSQFGYCLGTQDTVAKLIIDDDAANVVAGIAFIDSNADGIRNPREVTRAIPGVQPVAFLNGSTSQSFAVNQHADGTLLAGLTSDATTGVGGVTTQSFLPAAAFPAPNGTPLFTVAAEFALGANVTGLKAADGSFHVASVCGTVDDRLRVGPRLADASNDTILNGYFTNKLVVNTQTNGVNARIVGAEPSGDATYRLPDHNQGFTCVRSLAAQTVQIDVACGDATLNTSSTEITDVFTITLQGTPPAYQTWLTATTVREFTNTAISADDVFGVLSHSVDLNINNVGNPTFNSTALLTGRRTDIFFPISPTATRRPARRSSSLSSSRPRCRRPT